MNTEQFVELSILELRHIIDVAEAVIEDELVDLGIKYEMDQVVSDINNRIVLNSPESTRLTVPDLQYWVDTLNEALGDEELSDSIKEEVRIAKCTVLAWIKGARCRGAAA